MPVEGSAGGGIEEHPLAAGEAIHELLQLVEVLLGDEAVLPGIPEGDLAPGRCSAVVAGAGP